MQNGGISVILLVRSISITHPCFISSFLYLHFHVRKICFCLSLWNKSHESVATAMVEDEASNQFILESCNKKTYRKQANERNFQPVYFRQSRSVFTFRGLWVITWTSHWSKFVILVTWWSLNYRNFICNCTLSVIINNRKPFSILFGCGFLLPQFLGWLFLFA